MDPLNIHEKTFRTHEIPTRKNLGPTKYPREKISDPRNTQGKKFETHEIPTTKIRDPQNTHRKIFWTHEIPTRKIFRPTKARWHRIHENHDGTRLTKFSTLEKFLLESTYKMTQNFVEQVRGKNTKYKFFTIKLSIKTRQWNKKYETCQFCIRTWQKWGSYGIIKVALKNKKQSLLLPFECLSSN